ncbi:hypothetical protein ACOME3_003948 [Neoechinorhynchus agilis]
MNSNNQGFVGNRRSSTDICFNEAFTSLMASQSAKEIIPNALKIMQSPDCNQPRLSHILSKLERLEDSADREFIDNAEQICKFLAERQYQSKDAVFQRIFQIIVGSCLRLNEYPLEILRFYVNDACHLRSWINKDDIDLNIDGLRSFCENVREKLISADDIISVNALFSELEQYISHRPFQKNTISFLSEVCSLNRIMRLYVLRDIEALICNLNADNAQVICSIIRGLPSDSDSEQRDQIRTILDSCQYMNVKSQEVADVFYKAFDDIKVTRSFLILTKSCLGRFIEQSETCVGDGLKFFLKSLHSANREIVNYEIGRAIQKIILQRSITYSEIRTAYRNLTSLLKSVIAQMSQDQLNCNLTINGLFSGPAASWRDAMNRRVDRFEEIVGSLMDIALYTILVDCYRSVRPNMIKVTEEPAPLSSFRHRLNEGQSRCMTFLNETVPVIYTGNPLSKCQPFDLVKYIQMVIFSDNSTLTYADEWITEDVKKTMFEMIGKLQLTDTLLAGLVEIALRNECIAIGLVECVQLVANITYRFASNSNFRSFDVQTKEMRKRLSERFADLLVKIQDPNLSHSVKVIIVALISISNNGNDFKRRLLSKCEDILSIIDFALIGDCSLLEPYFQAYGKSLSCSDRIAIVNEIAMLIEQCDLTKGISKSKDPDFVGDIITKCTKKEGRSL